MGENCTVKSLMISTVQICERSTKFKKNQVGGPRGLCGEGERCIQSFGGETWRKSPLGRPSHKWEGNIKMDIGGLDKESVNWIYLAQDEGSGGLLCSRK